MSSFNAKWRLKGYYRINKTKQIFNCCLTIMFSLQLSSLLSGPMSTECGKLSVSLGINCTDCIKNVSPTDNWDFIFRLYKILRISHTSEYLIFTKTVYWTGSMMVYLLNKFCWVIDTEWLLRDSCTTLPDARQGIITQMIFV